MCRFTHPLAATGTMSWPHSGGQRPPATAPGDGLRRAFLVHPGTIWWPRLQV